MPRGLVTDGPGGFASVMGDFGLFGSELRCRDLVEEADIQNSRELDLLESDVHHFG